MESSSPSAVAESSRVRARSRAIAALVTTSELLRMFALTSLKTVACRSVNRVRVSAICPKSRIDRCMSCTVWESKAAWIREETVAISVAIRAACAVSCPMSGRVAPGHASSPWRRASSSSRRTMGSSGGLSMLMISACHSPKSDADAAITPGLGGSRTSS